MKRVGNIYSKICEIENIKKAIYKASEGKKHKKVVSEIVESADKYANIIHGMLINHDIRLKPYKKMVIHDGATKKERTIYKPAFFPDQIIHWCLMLIIEPILKRGMYELCCASVKGRGINRGVKYLKKILKNDKKNTKYCLKLDIKHFYPSVNKLVLKRKLNYVIKDYEVIELCEKIIDSSEEGLPIGNYTSQWFANFYLQDLDHYIKEQLHIKYYLRYMDDMALFSRNKKELHKARAKVEEFLNKEGLRLKENWQLYKVDSRNIDFLGYRFGREYTKIRRGNFLRIKRRIQKIIKKDRITKTDAGAYFSYMGYLKHCDSFNYINKYIKPYLSAKKCKGVLKNGSKFTNRIKSNSKQI